MFIHTILGAIPVGACWDGYGKDTWCGYPSGWMVAIFLSLDVLA